MSSREEFEKTMAPLFEENLGMNPDPSVWHKNKNGSYLNPVLEQHFVTWQAARATPALPQVPEGMAIVPVERLKYLNDHHHATESGVGLARLALSRGDTQRAIEALNSTSEKLDSILDMLSAAKEPATCSVCGLKRSDTKNCNAPDCSPMLAAAKEKQS